MQLQIADWQRRCTRTRQKEDNHLSPVPTGRRTRPSLWGTVLLLCLIGIAGVDSENADAAVLHGDSGIVFRTMGFSIERREIRYTTEHVGLWPKLAQSVPLLEVDKCRHVHRLRFPSTIGIHSKILPISANFFEGNATDFNKILSQVNPSWFYDRVSVQPCSGQVAIIRECVREIDEFACNGETYTNWCHPWTFCALQNIQLAPDDSHLLTSKTGIPNNSDDAAECNYKHRKIVGMPPLIIGILIAGLGWILLWGRRRSLVRAAIGIPLCIGGFWAFGWGISHVDPLLAPLYCRSENVGIEAIVVAKLKLRDVKRKIFATDFMETADDPALNQRPKTFDCVRMDRTDNVMAVAVPHDAMRVSIVHAIIGIVIISAEQAHFVRNNFVYKFFNGIPISTENNASDNIPFSPNRANYGSFTPIVTATASVAPFIPMTIFVVAADIGFIDLNDTAELVHVAFNHRSADFVTHKPSGFDRTEAHVAPNLARTHALFAGEHQVSDLEPVPQRLVGVFKNRPGDDRKTIAVLGAFFALPMPFAGRQIVDAGIAATRAMNALRPSAGLQIGFAGILIVYGKHPVELGGTQLVDWLGHRSIPSQWKDIAL